MSESHSLLVLPHVRVQNANAISSPMTWGFPAMTAFVGLMHLLERRLAERDIPLLFEGVGVVCHHCEPQASHRGYTHAFHLTRNPVGRDGDTAAIVEEGRVHLDVSLVFAVRGDACAAPAEERDAIAREVGELLLTLRVAGGTVLPGSFRGRRWNGPELIPLDEQEDERRQQSKRLLRRWLPGFALVCRDDLLHERHAEMRADDPDTTLLDAWLDLSRLNMTCRGGEDDGEETIRWEARRRPGWLVPIPVGYGALGPLQAGGDVRRARDTATPLRFVESLYSIGQWVSPHRLDSPERLLWYVDNRLDEGRYRLRNDYIDNAAEFV
ncbi:type I-F CRISPR-associated protein Csy2 [Arhodomonas aquaeolei]|uniref:type I-F CRISPR-associated protein Csy2 n=1 Tax=Arhodomonas aquaeolei TaxID=2369 RepID=UPI0021692794|nr:type I-F CRISPR-associated protein Csy2 [Arhodomonas aquaeolei]MCS4505225.1 type I-F CRISPR-associated protein Csy2 [Arhodomonas aquaeolei]